MTLAVENRLGAIDDAHSGMFPLHPMRDGTRTLAHGEDDGIGFRLLPVRAVGVQHADTVAAFTEMARDFVQDGGVVLDASRGVDAFTRYAEEIDHESNCS